MKKNSAAILQWMLNANDLILLPSHEGSKMRFSA